MEVHEGEVFWANLDPTVGVEIKKNVQSSSFQMTGSISLANWSLLFQLQLLRRKFRPAIFLFHKDKAACMICQKR